MKGLPLLLFFIYFRYYILDSLLKKMVTQLTSPRFYFVSSSSPYVNTYFKNKIYIHSLLLLPAIAPQSPLVSTLASFILILRATRELLLKCKKDLVKSLLTTLRWFLNLLGEQSSSPYNALQSPVGSDSQYLLI